MGEKESSFGKGEIRKDNPPRDKSAAAGAAGQIAVKNTTSK